MKMFYYRRRFENRMHFEMLQCVVGLFAFSEFLKKHQNKKMERITTRP